MNNISEQLIELALTTILLNLKNVHSVDLPEPARQLILKCLNSTYELGYEVAKGVKS